MTGWVETVTIVLTQIVMLVGLIGLIIPVFPGITVIWVAALIYGFLSGFTPLGIVIMVTLTLFMIFGTLVDNLLMGAGARKGGASWLTIGVALLAGIVGTIIFPPIGGLIAAPLAIFALEYIRIREVRGAWYALRGLVGGWGLSFLVRFGVGLVMIILWWIWVWKG
jgi:uncharacterized protein YqgC (DUF456 family)